MNAKQKCFIKTVCYQRIATFKLNSYRQNINIRKESVLKEKGVGLYYGRKNEKKKFWSLSWYIPLVFIWCAHCPSRNQAGIFATGEIRQNIKFAAFWCVFLTKKKVDPESWWKILSIKQLRKKKIPKDILTWSRSRI